MTTSDPDPRPAAGAEEPGERDAGEPAPADAAAPGTPDAERAHEGPHHGASGRAAAVAERFESLASSGMGPQALLAAMGGVRGIVEALLPGIVFLVLYTITGQLFWSVVVPAIVAVLFVIVRAATRQNVVPAVGGLVAIAVSGLLALRTGDGRDYYVLGFYTNGAYGLAFLVSILVGWPLIGFLAGLAYGSVTDWRARRHVRRLMQWATVAWVLFFGLRLAVQVPLYFANEVGALGVTRLVMGTPMYAILAVGTVLFARAVFRSAGLANRDTAQPDG